MRTALSLPCGALLVAASLAVGTAPAHASCAGPQSQAVLSQPVQFVGRVVEPERGVTLFRVEEVWTGPDLAPDVWVETGERARGAGSSVDLHPETGDRYLVGADAGLGTSVCTALRVTGEAQLAALRPSTVRPSVADGLEGQGPRRLLLSGLALGGTVVLCGALALALGLRRRHRARG